MESKKKKNCTNKLIYKMETHSQTDRFENRLPKGKSVCVGGVGINKEFEISMHALCACTLSHFSHVGLCVTPWTVA